MTPRPKVPRYRPGQVPPGGLYAPLQWDRSNPRFAEIADYTPKVRPASWPEHRDVALDLVMRTLYVDRKRDREDAAALHHIFTWAKDFGFATAPESLLTGDRIDACVRALWSNKRSRATYRTRLRKVAAAVFPAPPEDVIYRQHAASAHSDDDMQRFLFATKSLVAGHKGTLPTRRNMFRDMEVILGLTFGAGTNGREVHRVRESWLRRDADVWWLHREGRAVPTPISSRWAAMIHRMLRAAKGFTSAGTS